MKKKKQKLTTGTQCLGKMLPVYKIVIDDCDNCGVKSIELVPDPLPEFKFIKINK